MPGAGKSTIGVLLAKYASYNFVDTDLLIQIKQDRSLQHILDNDGYLILRKYEEEILLSLDCTNHIIATGGSAVYSSLAMEYLKKDAITIFLDVDLDEIRKRVKDFDTRGIARKPGQSFDSLYSERQALYKKYTDITINCLDKSKEDIVAEICHTIQSVNP